MVEEGLEFKWGKKRGIGGKKKDVQFYESFTFDGDEYSLYDSVFIGDPSEPETSEPFVGKIIKIWENGNKRAKFTKQVKLLWFFKPCEISAYLDGVSDVLPNELFLASGEGCGLANVNQLEALGGKCTVVCISKDARNPQPSDELVKSADFVFRRAFDVGSCKVVDQIDDKIAGVDAKSLFNSAGCEKEAAAVQEIEGDVNENPGSLKPNVASVSDPVRKVEDNSVESDSLKSKGLVRKVEDNYVESDSLKPKGLSASGPVRKVEDKSVASDSLKPNGPSVSGSVRKVEEKSVASDSLKPKSPSVSGSVRKVEDKSVASDSLKPKGSSGSGLVRKVEDNSVESDILKPKSPSASGPVRKVEDNSVESDSLKPKSPSVNGSVKKVEDNSVETDSLKPKGPSVSGPVRKTENSVESSDYRESSNGCKEEKEKGLNQLAKKKPTVSEERSNKVSGVQKGIARNKDYSSEAASGKAQESEVRKQLTKQKSMPAEERYRNSSEASGSKVNHSNSKKAQVLNGVRKQLSKQKSMPAEESNGLNDRPQKKQKLDGPVIVPDGRNTNILQKSGSDGKKDTGSFKRPRDRVTREEVSPKKPRLVKKLDLGVSVSEGKDTKTTTEKDLSKRPSSEGKLLTRCEEKKMSADDYERNYQVIAVSRKPDVEKSKWFRPLPWEERMREAEKLETLVLLQNLDPTYTSDEVEDIVYSALNEQCTARMIPCTLATTPHIGQALVIFKSREAAEKAIGRLENGCLLLSNGRPLVAAFAKINPPGKPPSFLGHIKLLKTQMRREMREAVSTSHHAQPNTLEYDMSIEWCLHHARCKQAIESLSKRQLEEKKSMRISFKPKHP